MKVLIKGNIVVSGYVSTFRLGGIIPVTPDMKRMVKVSDYDMVIDAGYSPVSIDNLAVMSQDVEVFVDGTCTALGQGCPENKNARQ